MARDTKESSVMPVAVEGSSGVMVTASRGSAAINKTKAIKRVEKGLSLCSTATAPSRQALVIKSALELDSEVNLCISPFKGNG